MNADAEREKFGRSPTQRRTVSAADGDGGPELAQTQSDGLANTAVAAGDQGDFAGKRLVGMWNVFLNAFHVNSAFLRPRFLSPDHHNLKSLRRNRFRERTAGSTGSPSARFDEDRSGYTGFSDRHASGEKAGELCANIPACVRTRRVSELLAMGAGVYL